MNEGNNDEIISELIDDYEGWDDYLFNFYFDDFESEFCIQWLLREGRFDVELSIEIYRKLDIIG
jgi:hypothetical protein